MSAKLLLIFILLAWQTGCVSYSYSGVLSGQNSIQQQSFSIPAGNSIFSIYFNITTMGYSNTLLVAGFAPITSNYTPQQLSSLVSTNDPQLGYMNILAAIGDSPQIINIYIPTNVTTLYVSMFNFDLPEVTISKSYYMAMEFSNNIKICEKCPPGGGTTSGLSCQCSLCSLNAIGPACQYTLNPLTSSANFTVPANKNRYFLISGTSRAEILAQEISLTGSVVLYAQYQYVSDRYPDGVLPGKINTAYIGNQSAQLTLSLIPATLFLPSTGMNIMLTFHNYGNSTASVLVSIPTPTTPISSLNIILAVVFGLVGLAILIFIAYRVRKWWSARNSVVINVPPAVIVDENSLTEAEINKYFPEVSAAIFLQTDMNASTSEMNINNEGSLSRVDKLEGREMLVECSICFDEVRATQLARVTYCRHIFHAKCLLQWFHKNQICPNCRQLCDYIATSRLRKALGRKAKANADSLVKAILGENFLSQLQNKARPLRREKQFTKLQQTKQLQEKEIKEERVEERAVQQVHESDATENQVSD